MLKNIFLYILIQFLIFYSALYAELVSPVNNSILNYVHVLFEWDQIPDALEYRFQVSSEDDFSTVVSDTIVSSLVFIEKNNIEWSSNYYWRIKPIYIISRVHGQMQIHLLQMQNAQMQRLIYIMISSLIQD